MTIGHQYARCLGMGLSASMFTEERELWLQRTFRHDSKGKKRSAQLIAQRDRQNLKSTERRCTIANLWAHPRVRAHGIDTGTSGLRCRAVAWKHGQYAEGVTRRKITYVCTLL